MAKADIQSIWQLGIGRTVLQWDVFQTFTELTILTELL